MALETTENIKRILTQLYRTFSQDTASIQTGSALWASLVQVLLRCRVSADSYRKAPEEDHYTKRESKEVIYRELGGFTSSYGVVKVISNTLKNWMTSKAGYRLVSPGTTTVGEALNNIRKVVTGQLKVVEEPPAVLSGKVDLVAINPKGQAALKGFLSPEWLAQTGQKLQKWHVLDKNILSADLPKKAFKTLHTWIPLAVGTIPALLISGWFLEYATLKRGAKIGAKHSNQGTDDNKKAIVEKGITTFTTPVAGHFNQVSPAPFVRTNPVVARANLNAFGRTPLLPQQQVIQTVARPIVNPLHQSYMQLPVTPMPSTRVLR
jgi:hypothetical protein